MAKVRHNNFTMGLSGKFGNIVFRQMKDGRTVVAAAPDFSNRKFSKEQQAHQSRFKKAAEYASEASKTNPLYAQLAQKRSKTPYTLALSDWFHPPAIHEVTRAAGYIRVKASDNVQVMNVLVTILDEEGNTVEQGQATSLYGDFWQYAASAEGKVIVEAFDLAGNITRYEVPLNEKITA